MRLTTIGKLLGSLATLAFAIIVSDASGATMVNEPFSYADGNLVGNNPPRGGAWNAHSGAASVPVQVSGGDISLVQGAGSREDVNVPFEDGAIGAGDIVYAAFDLTIADPGAAIVSVNFAHMLEGTSAFAARVWTTTPTATGYRLALSNDNSITDADGEVFTSDLAFGTTYRVVTKYDHDDASSMLWVNPVDESSASISATDPGFVDEVASYAFRQSAGNTIQVLDNLCVSGDFDEALHCVPEPASAMLLMLAGLGLACARRRAG